MSDNSTTYNKVLSKGLQNNLPGIEDGKLRFTTDTARLFLDDNNQRIEFTDFVKDKTKDQILSIESPLPKLYLASDTHELYCHDNDGWHSISSSGGSSTYAENAGTAEFAYQANYATNASTANEAYNSTYAETANYAQGAGYATNAASSEYAYFAEHTGDADTATHANYAEYAGTASYVSTADYANAAYTAEYAYAAASVSNAESADFASTAGYAQNAENASTASWADSAYTAENASTAEYASEAGYATNAGTAEYTVSTNYAENASTATYAEYASEAGYAANAVYDITREGTIFIATKNNGDTFTFDQQDNNTTYDNFSTASAGLVPKSSGIQDTFLRFDGQWAVPSGGGGGSNVSVTADLTTGTKIATMTIDAATTALYAPPNDSVIQRPITSGSGEILLSNGSTYGETRKFSDFNFNTTDKILTIKSPNGENIDPHIYIWNLINYGRGYHKMMDISPTDIEISYSDEAGEHDGTWDGTNRSLQAALRSFTYYGVDPPATSLGKNGSIYFRMSTSVASPDREIIDIYFKADGVWSRYNPEIESDYDFGELTEEPTGDVLLYDWDFRESMIDRVEGYENVPGANIPDYDYTAEISKRDNTLGLYADGGGSETAPIAQIPVDLRFPGYKVEIEFGNFTMNYSDYCPSIIGSYADPAEHPEGVNVDYEVYLLYYEGLEIISHPCIAGYIPDDVVVDTNDDTYFSNSKVTIRTVAIETPELHVTDPVDYGYSSEWYAPCHSYDIVWEIYKDDVLVGTTPAIVTGQYLGTYGGIPEPNVAQLPGLGYYAPDPSEYFWGISFGIPCNGSELEIKTLKIYREN